MPAVPRAVLTERLLQAFEDAGATCDLISTPTSNPRRLVLRVGENTMSLSAYLWTLTFGGRTNLPDEYRIQMTSVTSPLRLNPSGPTLLLGYEPNLMAFAGFDISRHCRFTEGSPSVQIDIRLVRQAITQGLVPSRKGNSDVVCGIRPDYMVMYSLSAEDIHRYGRARQSLQMLDKLIRGGKLTKAEEKILSKPRKRVMKSVSSWTRNASFRRLVLQAYDHRCAVTGLQLKLVDAAHLLPVGAPGSTDHVTNGIALSPTYHRAYDRGLIFFDAKYNLQLNGRKAAELHSLGLDGGLAMLKKYIGQTLILPSNRSLRPSINYIGQANKFRRVS